MVCAGHCPADQRGDPKPRKQAGEWQGQTSLQCCTGPRCHSRQLTAEQAAAPSTAPSCRRLALGVRRPPRQLPPGQAALPGHCAEGKRVGPPATPAHQTKWSKKFMFQDILFWLGLPQLHQGTKKRLQAMAGRPVLSALVKLIFRCHGTCLACLLLRNDLQGGGRHGAGFPEAGGVNTCKSAR